ncbi:MAG: hypothetical protein QNK24_02790 [Desulfuromusa sp.]|nr:hypothetical protein [Desulfuromusa sp.]
MQGLLIANEDRESREGLAKLFSADDVQVETTDSVVNGLEGILNKTIQVVVLGGDFDEAHVAKLVPLLKKCNRYLSIILISDEISIDLLRRIRKEGIFYHALKPAGDEGREEIRQAVLCAFRNFEARRNEPKVTQSKEVCMQRIKTMLTSLSLVLMVVGPAMAAETAKTYSSGILVLAFVGVCALLVVAQLFPAIRSLFKVTKDAAQKSSKYSATVSAKKQ